MKTSYCRINNIEEIPIIVERHVWARAAERLTAILLMESCA